MATLAIRSATLWDGTHADPRPGTTVVMRDGEVTASYDLSVESTTSLDLLEGMV